MDILEKFKQFGLDTTKGGEQRIQCPNCVEVVNRTNPKDKCLAVNLNKNSYFCHKCGDDYKGVVEIQNKPSNDTYKTLTVPDSYDLSKKAIEFFKTRAISLNTLKRFKITSDDKAIKFNFFKKDKLINIKKRYPGKKFTLEAKCEIDFYNHDVINDELIVITEGEIDALSMYEADPNIPVVSLPNGASSLKFLDNKIDDLDKISEIVIATDGDEAGRKAKDNLLIRLGQDKCSFIEYPEGCKDLNDVLIKHGKEKVKECFDKRVRTPIKAVCTAEHHEAKLKDYIINGFPDGLATGEPNIDSKIKLMLGEFVLVTGTPNSGKSTLLDFLTSLHTSHLSNAIRVGMLSAENSVPIQIIKIASHFLKRKIDNLGKVDDEVTAILNFINDNYVFVDTTELDNMHYKEIIKKLKQMNKRYGCNYFIIDPYNYIEKDGNDHTAHAPALRAFANFAKAYNSLVILVAHPRKMEKQDDGNYKVATPYDIAGSADFYNIADTILSTWRNFSANQTEVHVQKIRNEWLGKMPSTFSLEYKNGTYEVINDLYR